MLRCRAAAVVASTLSVAHEARALGPIDVEVAGRIGGATSPRSNPFGINPLGFGVGGRAGVSFTNVYAGVSVMYYFGESEKTSCCSSFSQNMWLEGVEGGYNVVFDRMTLRPELGVGAAGVQTTNRSGYASSALGSSNSYFYLEPGLDVVLALGPLLIGTDANLLSFPNTNFPNLSFAAHGQLGVRF